MSIPFAAIIVAPTFYVSWHRESCIMQPEEISIGIICPLPIEVAAMIQMLDERYSTQQFPRDPNLYHLGRIGEHNIIRAGLPDGLTSIASATTVAERL
jgi:hypothetical protein